MILLIDHYDSFTYNIFQAAAELGKEIQVVRYGVLTVDEIVALQPEAIILSPGPGHPEELPESLQLIEAVHASIPLLGICLGHQLIGTAFGGKVVQAPEIRHGKVSMVTHQQQGAFAGLPTPLPVMRYHSLAIEESSLPDCFDVQAIAEDDGTIMAVKHRDYPVYGFQFHPESIGTPEGKQLLEGFLAAAKKQAALK
ncbi:Aminodeoxychorismate synthase component 2 [Planococcus massiliensis]|uniref:Aminodeoxychorismate synthase component 2 n=1 Tax=Planococcus massiliensis TaxID=1499687 RepID=A0A098EPP4_9BACL|nr:aminodeoxychorismate/anthranilate synthase component II [Planococcus massiliensis]CEG24254.1 Aminodeoxychorismate synthase component 2 [Planococcus massiliensis]